ncbi:hypothetical protein [Nostoc sp. NMS8]|uniref:hypothetical protein n=1 Tax=Nostoc sp. NMS8 TaxID=2815392 RepID=UPI0025DA2D94|nr:hypothetical protein [Nostoc sp. NMS8]MBN3962536.1 hypothetical protein [Nostoc sp. NMS8]
MIKQDLPDSALFIIAENEVEYGLEQAWRGILAEKMSQIAIAFLRIKLVSQV